MGVANAFVHTAIVRASAAQPQHSDGATNTSQRCPTRRDALRYAAATLTAAAAGTLTLPPGCGTAHAASARQVANGVLAGYGLPTLAEVDGFTPLLEQYGKLVVEFQHPSPWIVARNVLPATTDSNSIQESSTKLSFGSSTTPMDGRASGLTVGDYRKAESLAFFTLSNLAPGKVVRDLPAETILNLVTPGDATGTAPEYTLTGDSINSETGYRRMTVKVGTPFLPPPRAPSSVTATRFIALTSPT